MIKIINEPSFTFSLHGLTSIHKRIYTGIFKHAGILRDYEISKKEWVLMGEENVLINRHLHIKAKELLDGATPSSTPTSTPTRVIPEDENVRRLISAIAEKQLSVK